MATRASLAGKTAARSPAKPYQVPADPMPFKFGGAANVRAEPGLASNTNAGLETMPQPTPVTGESEIPQAETAVRYGDGIRRGHHFPRQPDGRFAHDPNRFPAKTPGRR